MAGVDLALGLIGAIDVAVKWGTILVKTCSAFKHAEEELSQRGLRVELCWKKTSIQLSFLRDIWRQLDDEHQHLQERTLLVLVTILSVADSTIKGYLKNHDTKRMNVLGIDVNRPPKRAKATYAILKDSLDKTLAEMEQWQKRFDPSWYLVLRLQDRRVDRKLQDAPWKSKVMKTATNVRDVIASNTRRPATQIFLPENDLQSATIGQLAFTTARTMRRTPLSRLHIIDTIQCGTGVMYDHRRKGIRDFARKLNAAEPSELALLNCTGVVARKDGYQYELIFQLPDGMTDPRSLRYCLDSGVSRYSLSDRMQLATQLATAVCSVHTFGFVHKNIRPENIIVLRTRGSTMGSAFLLGFTEVRLETGFTQLIGSSRWEEDLYRHPQRQGHRIKDRYIMQHDIYSLGVCLLELGLGSPFVRYSVGANGYEEAKPATYTFGKHHRPGMEKGEAIQKELVALTKQSLAISMGNKYANIVLTCLTCLDKNNENFGEESEFQDDDGVLVAVRYIEKVLAELNSISI